MSTVPAIETRERERLGALASYGILDTDFEETYDRLTRLAADLFDTSISAISLIDLTRQWFKSRTGIETRETPRDIAFCDHAIRQTGVFVVADASADERFSANPLVVGGPGIRFYAGAPLFSPEGLCTITPTIDRVFMQETILHKNPRREPPVLDWKVNEKGRIAPALFVLVTSPDLS